MKKIFSILCLILCFSFSVNLVWADNNSVESTNSSIKDFSSLLKKTNKDKVGDSYYKWGMNLPKDLKISYRSFNGDYNYFEADDGSYGISLSIRDNENDTIDSLMAEELEYASNYTILNQSKENKNGIEYIKVTYKDSEGAYEDRIYIKNKKVYEISLWVEEYSKYKENGKFTSLINSFQLEFKDDGRSEDLSEVTSDGYRSYENENLKLSIDVLADWEKYQDADKQNEIVFSGKNLDNQEFDFINIKMFSKEDGLTLDKWIDNEVKFVKANYNSELVKILKIEDTKINNIPAKKLYMSFKENNDMMYGCSAYVIGDNYKYEVDYLISADSYNSDEREKIEKSIHSFKFIEPDVSKLGQFIDVNSIFTDEKRTIENKQYKYSFEIPSDWIQGSEGKDSQSISYYNQKKQIQFDMGVGKNIDMDEFLDYYDNTILKQAEIMGRLKETKNETLNEKGTTVKKYINTLVIDDYTIKEVYYVLNKNGNLYTIVFDIRDITSSETNMKLIESIWKSMKFE